MEVPGAVATKQETGSATALLEVEDLRVRYGNIEAVRGLSFSVEEGTHRGPHRRQRRRQELDAPLL